MWIADIVSGFGESLRRVAATLMAVAVLPALLIGLLFGFVLGNALRKQ